jgi:hypothetical protein
VAVAARNLPKPVRRVRNADLYELGEKEGVVSKAIESATRLKRIECRRLLADATTCLNVAKLGDGIPPEESVSVAFCQLMQYLKLKQVDPFRLLRRHERSLARR